MVKPINLGRGFTLVEILVVILIVSIMSGIVIASLPGFTRGADFETETRRVKALLELIREEALMQSTEYGFKLDTDGAGRLNGYSFHVYDELNQAWVQFEEPPFRARELDEGIEARLDIEGEPFSLDEEDDEATPSVMILSSGELTPFSLSIFQGRDLSRTLVSDGYGDLIWEDEQDEAQR